MADNYLLYDLTLTPQAPVHIGSGRELLHEYDYAIRAGQTWRIDETALLDAQNAEDPRVAERLARTKPAQLLRDADFRPDGGFFRYVLKGTPRSAAEGAQLREQLKDPFDRPYVPGSSLKGALRTALAWHEWQQRGLRPDLGVVGQRKQWAAQKLEQMLFGPDPKRDALRALHVSDSAPLAPAALMIVNVRAHHRNGQLAAPIELEALRPDAALRFTLKLDLALYSDWARRAGLNLLGRDWLDKLPAIVQRHAAERLQREYDWFAKIRGAERLKNAYGSLASLRPAANQCLIQLGWGTGWESKTFGSRLQADPQFMERVIGDFRLARGKWQRNDPFPKSRRIAVRSPQGVTAETPAAPLGWCLLEFQPRR